MSPQRHKIEFEPNVPVLMTLEYDGGKQVPARNGVQYLYWVDGERSAFLDEQAHLQIQASGAKAGATLEVTKTLKGRPAKVGWEVVHVLDEPTDAQPQPARNDIYPQRTQAQRAPQPVEPIRPPAPPPLPAGTHPVTRATTDLVTAFSNALDALQEAQRMAKQRGVDFRFDSESIRRTALSIYINSVEGGC